MKVGIFSDVVAFAEKISSENLKVPNSPIGKGETDTGHKVADPGLQQLFSAMVLLKRDAHIAVVHAAAADQQEQQQFMARAARLMLQSELASQAFWAGVHDEFKLWNEQKQLGIREGWKIVTCEPGVDLGGLTSLLSGFALRRA